MNQLITLAVHFLRAAIKPMSWAYVLLRAAIYLIDSTVKKSDFELTALATVD